MGSDDLFEPHEVVRTGCYPIFPYTARRTPERDQTRQRAWHLDPGKPFLPGGLTDQHRQIQAQIRDMGKWPPRVKRQWRQDWEDHLCEIFLDVGLLATVQVWVPQ